MLALRTRYPTVRFSETRCETTGRGRLVTDFRSPVALFSFIILPQRSKQTFGLADTSSVVSATSVARLVIIFLKQYETGALYTRFARSIIVRFRDVFRWRGRSENYSFFSALNTFYTRRYNDTINKYMNSRNFVHSHI